MVAAMGPALANVAGSTWVAAAISPGDRRAAELQDCREIPLAHGSVHVRSLVLEQDAYDAFYNQVANRALWFTHHRLFDTPHTPVFDTAFQADWAAYHAANDTFAEACAQEAAAGGTVFIQDYHLALAPALLRARRPDVAIAHFTHCPWSDPDTFAMLPGDVASQVLEGMLGADLVGFLVPRWVRRFLECCQAAGYDVDRTAGTVRVDDRVVHVRAYPLGVDPDDLQERARSADVERAVHDLAAWTQGRTLVVRADRMELSKNLLRGLAGYEAYLAAHPEAHGHIVHLALAYGSREGLPEYREYAQQVAAAADAINRSYQTESWQPVRLEVADDYPRALAALRSADVLIVNPVWDGMNLVAKEGPSVSDRDGVLILSRNAGAVDDLEAGALIVNPFDVVELADAIARAVALPDAERATRAAALRAGASALPPEAWFALQREDLASLSHARARGADAPLG